MPSIKVPQSLCRLIAPAFSEAPESPEIAKEIRSAVKSMIENAIRDDIPPARLPVASESGPTFNISFAAREDKAIRALAKSLSIREGDAVLMYLYAAVARGDAIRFQKERTNFMLRYLAALPGMQPRHHQSICGEYLLDALNSNQIGMTEASTGVGKTLAIIAACAEVLREKTIGRCVIAVPTIQLLRQFAQQHKALADGGLDKLPSGRFVVGRAEFVCVSELEAFLDAETTEIIDPAPIRDWLAAGGQPLGKGEELGSNYLLSSLREVSPLFPIDAVRLSIDSEPDDPGAKAYAEQFARDDASDDEVSTEIIYCTHAMLAVDLRRRMQVVRQTGDGMEIIAGYQKTIAKQLEIRRTLKDIADTDVAAVCNAGRSIRDLLQSQLEELTELASWLDVGILPSWQHVVIDEAHIFENNLANTLSANISLERYVRNLGKLVELGIISKAAHSRALAALNAVRAKGDCDEVDLSEDSPLAREFRAALQEMSVVILGSKKAAAGTGNVLGIARIQAQAISIGLKAAAENRGERAFLMYSPVRAYPQLSVGRQNVRPQLAFLWQTAISGASISATLYLRKLDKDSAGYMAGVLNVPPMRLREYPVIRPAWIHEPVIGLWMPEAVKVDDGQYWLRPPSRRDKLNLAQQAIAESRWLEDVAKVLGEIHTEAIGGVLVLLGSYASASSLSERLGAQVEAIVTANQKHPIHEQLTQFVDFSLSGKKPVWLAVGGAWTGIDINGENYGIENPANDNLVTDLVIPRFPFRLNRSMTHRTRIETQSSVPWELLDAAMRFKQGLGRLVRRPGLPANRRVFVLDGRCNDPLFENYLSHLRRLMAVYPEKRLTRIE